MKFNNPVNRLKRAWSMRPDGCGSCIVLGLIIIDLVLFSLSVSVLCGYALHWLLLYLVPTMPDWMAWVLAVVLTLALGRIGSVKYIKESK